VGEHLAERLRVRVGEAAGVHVLGRVLVALEVGEALTAASLEVALLDRSRPSRAFRRIKGEELEGLLA